MQRLFAATLAAMATTVSFSIHPASGAVIGSALALPFRDRAPSIGKIACWGWGWRGPGVYVSPLGLRAACRDAPLVAAPAYVTPGYPVAPLVLAPAAPPYAAPPPPTWYYCDNPKGYYPSVATCTSGWRTVPTAP